MKKKDLLHNIRCNEGWHGARMSKMNISVKIMIGFIIILSLSIVIFGKLGPPKPLVMAEGQQITTEQGSYCWNTLVSNTCVDKISPIDMMVESHTMPTAVSPNSTIEITFKKSPIADIIVNRWQRSDENEGITMTNHTFTAPENPGVYIYSVYGEWVQGSSSVVFAIEVQE